MSENDTPFFCDYSYERRAEGLRLLVRLSVVLGYVIFAAAYFAAAYYTRLIPLFALCPAALWIIIYFTWPHISYDFYFEFRSGTLTLGKEGRKKRRIKRTPRLTIPIKCAGEIYPIPVGRVKLSSNMRCFDFSGTSSSTRRIAIVFDKNGKKCTCVLECTSALAKMIRSYSNNAEQLADFIKSL